MLKARVDAWNHEARLRNIDYPRYDGGFFVSVFTDQAATVAKAMREQGVFAVPQGQSLRIALCAVPTSTIPRLVDVLGSALEPPH